MKTFSLGIIVFLIGAIYGRTVTLYNQKLMGFNTGERLIWEMFK